MATCGQDNANGVHHGQIRLVDDGNTACHCHECTRIKQAAAQPKDCNWWADDEAAKAVSRARKTVWEARLALHRAHRASLYDQGEVGADIVDDRYGNYDYVHGDETDDDTSVDVSHTIHRDNCPAINQLLCKHTQMISTRATAAIRN